VAELTGVGVFTSARKVGERAVEVARTAEELGYDAIWVADVRGDLSVLGRLLAASDRIRAGSAILSMWDLEASAAAAAWAAVDAQGPGRAVAGIGVSHSLLVERSGRSYDKPLTRLRDYLDRLDALEAGGIPVDQRMIGANGPRMLQLAGERTAGALTYLVTPERTAEQREELGARAVLAPEIKVALAADREAARALAREHLAVYLNLPNYLGNLERMGFTAEDFTGGGSDRLIDTLVVGPDVEDVVQRIAEHRDAGADHVCLQVLGPADSLPLDQWRELAPAVCTPRGN
jgi:probable F420-dependent oxidoreductase